MVTDLSCYSVSSQNVRNKMVVLIKLERRIQHYNNSCNSIWNN